MAAKMTTIVGDVTGLQQRLHPKNIAHLVKITIGKIVSKYCNISKTPGVGVWICLYVRGLKTLLKDNYKDFVIGLSIFRLVLF